MAGITEKASCTTVNKVCASGLKSIVFAAQSIRLGDAHVCISGGMESMSNTPFYLAGQPTRKPGLGYGGSYSMVDGIARDGLTNVYDGEAMGVCAELCANTYGISRQEQDTYAAQSFRRAIDATANGFFKQEIVPVEVRDRR